MTDLLWCSIDNDDSMDLDQLTACESLAQGALRIQVAIADIDALVELGSPIFSHARLNTTTVHIRTNFSMLPERLSTDLTSLNPHQNRLALVTDMVFDAEGVLTQSTLHRALVRNQAKLAYDAVSDWIDGSSELPAAAAAAVPGMAVQLRLQDALAQRLRTLRHAQGSLEFERSQPWAVFEGTRVVDLQQQVQNRARQLIEEFMIATNGCTARFLSSHGRASLRRVVRQRIVTVAHDRGHTLPAGPDAKALSVFLASQHRKDPVHFQDLSLIIVKLLGSGEYSVDSPNIEPVGHFGLAVRYYTHSTAPNRRYPDLITARLLKVTLKGELEMLAQHCTVQEDAAQKVERKMRKTDAAMTLESRVGQRFEALVTGSTPSGVWVRIFSPPAEGKLVDGQKGLSVGDSLRVKLIGTNVER